MSLAPPPPRERMLAAQLLSQPDYRNYWLGSTAFALGIWGFILSMGYSAKELTDSPLRVSLVSVAYFLPMFLGALPSGVLADAVDRRLTVIASRSVAALGAFGLASLTATDSLGYPALVALSALTGATVVSEVAARQAYVTQIVRPEQVVGATALGSVQGGIARVVGPLVAGALIATSGETAGYLFFAAANLACVVVFLRIKASGKPPRAAGRPVEELVAGLRYLRHHADALAITAIGLLTGVVGWVFLALMPVVVADELGGGALMLGVLSTMVGLGSVPPSLLLALRTGGPRREGRLFVLATLAWGLAVVVWGLTDSPVVAAVALAVCGAGNGLQQVLLRTLLLRIVDPAFHGRVMGTLMLTWGGSVVGTLAGGGLAESIGVGPVIALSGGVIVAITLAVLALRPSTWRL
jgi:MFS family permease